MPTIRCTSKLLKILAPSDAEMSTAESSSPLGDWYAHIFTIERRKCLLFINEVTLFNCLALGVTKREYADLPSLFRRLLEKTLHQDKFAADEIARVLDTHRHMALGKTQNRSTISAMNNRIGDAKFFVEYHGGLDFMDPRELVHELNETPMKPIKYSNGLEEMRRQIRE